jgi:hypothetical protein
MPVAFKVDEGLIHVKINNFDLNILHNKRPYLASDNINLEIQQYSIQEDGLIFRDDSFSLLRIIKTSKKSPRLIFLNEKNEIVFDQLLSVDGSVFCKEIDFAGITKFQNWDISGFKKLRRIAVFTHSFNESLQLEIFYNHYSKLTDPQDIYVIDHGSDSVKAIEVIPGKCQIIYLPKTPRDDFNIKQYCEYFQRFLLTQYEWVIHVDVDEILIHELGMNHLRDQLFSDLSGFICLPEFAAELVEHPDIEPELVGFSELCKQRNYMIYNNSYLKPAVTSIPAYWGPGFHYCLNDLKTKVIPGLWMMHLKSVSIKHQVDHFFIRQSNDFSEQMMEANAGNIAPQRVEGKEGVPWLDRKNGGYFLVNREEFERLCRNDWRTKLNEFVSIPDWLKEAL